MTTEIHTEHTGETLVTKRQRGRPRIVTEDPKHAHRLEIIRKACKRHYDKHKDDKEWMAKKYKATQELAKRHPEETSKRTRAYSQRRRDLETPEQRHETNEKSRRNYYMKTYGSLERYIPKVYQTKTQ